MRRDPNGLLCLLRLAFYEKRVKRVLAGIVIVYGIAVVMLGSFAYINHVFPKHNTPATLARIIHEH